MVLLVMVLGVLMVEPNNGFCSLGGSMDEPSISLIDDIFTTPWFEMSGLPREHVQDFHPGWYL